MQAASCGGEQLVRRRSAPVAAEPLRLVGDQTVLAVDHNLLPERAGDRAGCRGDDHAARPGRDDRSLLQRRVRAARHGHADDERAEPGEVPGVPEGLRRHADRRREARAAARTGDAHDDGAGAGADGDAAAGDGGDAAEPAGDAARLRRAARDDAAERRHLLRRSRRARALRAARDDDAGERRQLRAGQQPARLPAVHRLLRRPRRVADPDRRLRPLREQRSGAGSRSTIRPGDRDD